jgi:hypothetical protein
MPPSVSVLNAFHMGLCASLASLPIVKESVASVEFSTPTRGRGTIDADFERGTSVSGDRSEPRIQRRFFLKLSGYVVAASALSAGALPAVAQAQTDEGPAVGGTGEAATRLRPPGTYQVSGQVRLLEPLVEISGISNAHQISWSPGALSSPVTSFTSFEHFDRPWQMPEIRVRGGRLEALTVRQVDAG